MYIRISAIFLLVAVWSVLGGCADDSCGAHQHSYRFRCVCDMDYIMVADTCVPLEMPVGWCPGNLVCTQLANDYMACTNADGTLPGDPTQECPDYAAAENNTSWQQLDGENVCILHCGTCTAGECYLVGTSSQYAYFCATKIELYGETHYLLPDGTHSCTSNSDCPANRTCSEVGLSEKYCIEHCSLPQREDGDGDTD